MTPARGLIFDLDGTLVDAFGDIAAAVNHAFAVLGEPALSVAEVKSHVGHGLRNLLCGLLPEAGSQRIDQALGLVKSYYADHPTTYSEAYPGVLETLQALRQAGYRTALLSNKADPLVQQIARNLGLEPQLEEVWGHCEEYPLKPDPTSLFEICRRLQVEPEDCVVVGDGLPDRDLALQAGTAFCPCSYGLTPASEWTQQGLDRTIASLAELPQWLSDTCSSCHTEP